MIINVSNLSTVYAGYNKAFKEGFASAENYWKQVATEVPSATESNIYAFLGQFPKMREWLGDRQIKNIVAEAYTLTNKDWESTVAVPRNKINDDTYGIYSPMMSELGYTAKMHPDEILFAKLAAGATDLCYDGQAFFDASHPVVSSGVASTASNYDSTAVTNLWVLMDTRRPIKPLIWQMRQGYEFQAFNKTTDENVFMRKEFLYGVDARAAAGYGLWQLAYGSLNTLNATNFNAAVAAMMAYKSNEDKPLGIRPNLLVTGPSNRAAARTLIETQFLSSGASNPNYKEVEILITPHLT